MTIMTQRMQNLCNRQNSEVPMHLQIKQIYNFNELRTELMVREHLKVIMTAKSGIKVCGHLIFYYLWCITSDQSTQTCLKVFFP